MQILDVTKTSYATDLYIHLHFIIFVLLSLTVSCWCHCMRHYALCSHAGSGVLDRGFHLVGLWSGLSWHFAGESLVVVVTAQWAGPHLRSGRESSLWWDWGGVNTGRGIRGCSSLNGVSIFHQILQSKPTECPIIRTASWGLGTACDPQASAVFMRICSEQRGPATGEYLPWVVSCTSG